MREFAERNNDINNRFMDISNILSKIENEDRQFAEEEERKFQEKEAEALAANIGKIDNLDGDKAALQTKKDEAAAAKALFDEFNPADVANRPASWTEELAEQYADDFYNKQFEVDTKQKEVDEI
jgi:hypothetical protein